MKINVFTINRGKRLSSREIDFQGAVFFTRFSIISPKFSRHSDQMIKMSTPKKIRISINKMDTFKTYHLSKHRKTTIVI